MASWHVTSDLPGQYEFDAAGNPVTGHVITFLTGHNNAGTVFVPDSHYNVNAVRAMIGVKAELTDTIASLHSDS